MKKGPAVPKLALKTSEKGSASKQKLYTRNQKKLKLLVTKNPDCNPFRLKVQKTHCPFFQLHFFLFREKYKVMLYLAAAFQRYQIY